MNMKFSIFASALFMIAGVSCEKHRWEDEVITVAEKADKGNDKAEVIKNSEEIGEKGAKRFFVDVKKEKEMAAEAK